MKNYTIIKVGSDYVVQAEEQSVLKVASRRRAAKLMVEASWLMGSGDVEVGEAPLVPDGDKDPA